MSIQLNEKTKILKIAEDLIRYHSTNNNQEQLSAIVEHVAGIFSDSEFFIKKFSHNGIPSILITTMETKRPDILLNGHLDVVKAYPDQFQPEVKNGYLYGRGAVDMKLFDAVAIQVLLDLHEKHPDMSVGAYFSCDEEVGGVDGAGKFIEDGYSSRLLINGDAGVDYALVTGSKGILRFKMIAETKPGRPAYPWEGINAAQVLIDGFNKIQQRFSDSHKANADDNWYSTYSIGRIETAQHPSGLPYKAQMVLGINFIDDLSYDELFEELQTLVPDLVLEKVNVAERLEVDGGNGVYQKFLSLAEKHFGTSFIVKKDNGSSDAKFFKNAMDEIIIVKMPGEGAHEPDERARIDSILPMYQTLFDFCESEYLMQEENIETAKEMK